MNQYDYTNNDSNDSYDSNTLTVLYFNWKTWEQSVFKIKKHLLALKKQLKKMISLIHLKIKEQDLKE